MEPTELTYQRESLRRGLQECLNKIDEATTSEPNSLEREKADLLASLKLLIAGEHVERFVEQASKHYRMVQDARALEDQEG